MLCVIFCLVLPPPPVSKHLFILVLVSCLLPLFFPWACLFICLSLSLWTVKQFNNSSWHDCLSVMKTLFFFFSVGLKIEESILLSVWGGGLNPFLQTCQLLSPDLLEYVLAQRKLQPAVQCFVYVPLFICAQQLENILPKLDIYHSGEWKHNEMCDNKNLHTVNA